jgi:hypothetical protein
VTRIPGRRIRAGVVVPRGRALGLAELKRAALGPAVAAAGIGQAPAVPGSVRSVSAAVLSSPLPRNGRRRIPGAELEAAGPGGPPQTAARRVRSSNY